MLVDEAAEACAALSARGVSARVLESAWVPAAVSARVPTAVAAVVPTFVVCRVVTAMLASSASLIGTVTSL